MKEEKIAGYEIKRKKIKNINIRISNKNGVVISAPINVDKKYVEEFILSKQKWIERTLEKINSNKFHENTWDNGDKIFILGNERKLIIIENCDNEMIKLDDMNIYLYTRENNQENNKKIIYKFYFEIAKTILFEVTEKWIKILELQINHISIKLMRTRWGSCNYKKKYINYNVELIKRSVEEIEYVVLHELAHIIHPNHSKQFYLYIEQYMPDYRKIEVKLKQFQL